MQPKSVPQLLIDVYESAYTVFKAGLISEGLEGVVLETAVLAAHQVAANRLHGQEDRAGAVGAALLRAVYGEEAAAKAVALSAAIRLHIADQDDPPTRAQNTPQPPPAMYQPPSQG